MNASSVIAMLQDKLPKNHAQLKTLEDKLNSFDETKINNLVSKIPQLNLKSPTIVFWVGSFVFGVLGVNRFMTGQTALGLAKLALFILYIVFIFLFSKLALVLLNKYLYHHLQHSLKQVVFDHTFLFLAFYYFV